MSVRRSIPGLVALGLGLSLTGCHPSHGTAKPAPAPDTPEVTDVANAPSPPAQPGETGH